MRQPDLVLVEQFAFFRNQPVGVAVRILVEISVRLEIAAVINELSARVLHLKRHPGFIEIALFGNQAMADFLILDDQIHRYLVARRYAIAAFFQRRDDLRLAVHGDAE